MKFKDFCEHLYLSFVDDRYIVEMTNLRQKNTGLHPVIHVMSKGGSKHGPRVKVSNIAGTFAHNDNFSITTESRVIGKSKLHPSHLDDIKDWVQLNKEHIHNVWHNGDIMEPDDVINGFKKV